MGAPTLWVGAMAFWETAGARVGDVLVMCAESQQDLVEELPADH